MILLKMLKTNILKLTAYKKTFFFIVGFLILAVYILSLNSALIFPSLQLDRKVLSILVFTPDTNSEPYQIMKVKISNKIMVEIYKIINQYNYELVSQIDTGSKYEGYFLLGGNATNLAYINIDDDPMSEIIVPGFDNNLSAHLNVIKFDSNTKSFTLVNQKISLENL
ncbi:MAG: hypothetical protein V4596_05080 [Bdellovibrionota bacterium]